MKDIVIMVGTALGSPLALSSAIKKEIDCKCFVLCTDFKTTKILNVSKVVDEAIHINNSSEADFIQSIEDWFQKKEFSEKPLMYFTYDTACYYVDKNRKWFDTRFTLCLPSSEIIGNFTLKGLAEVKASESGLIIPRTSIINCREDAAKIEHDFLFPVIVKPRATYHKKNLKFKTKIFQDKKSFVDFCSKVDFNQDGFLCQEYIPGDDAEVFYYLFYRTNNGTVIENMGRKILQSPPGGGIMAKGIVEQNDELSLMCKAFLKKINYVGFGGIEFKKWKDKFYFIEMNVRVEAFLQIAEASNTYLSIASYYDCTNDLKLTEIESKIQKDGVIYMDFVSTIIARLKTKRIFSLMHDITGALFSKKVILNVYSPRDTKPFWLSIKL